MEENLKDTEITNSIDSQKTYSIGVISFAVLIMSLFTLIFYSIEIVTTQVQN